MITFIFTWDYEIYGNGVGCLRDLVYEPTRILAEVFRKHNCKFVVFAEANELQQIDERKTDPKIECVKDQLRKLYEEGFEIGLHLHPQWCRAKYDGTWQLDYGEYNLCTLSRNRICEIVDQSINYLRTVLRDKAFTPLSFRAGNWLFQPSYPASSVLTERGVRIDSSVFKGGVRHSHNLDYRRSLRNRAPYWRFSDDVQEMDTEGAMIEIPIYSEMVPPWKMFGRKRVRLERAAVTTKHSIRQSLDRLRDMARMQQPLKFDCCRLSLLEQKEFVKRLIARHRSDSERIMPVVVIGHSKELVDIEAIESLLMTLSDVDVKISLFREIVDSL